MRMGNQFRLRDDERLERACDLMNSHLGSPLNVTQISKAANFSPYYFIRLFRKTFDITPHQYLTRQRVERAKRLLAESDHSITDICFDVGFESLSSFSNLFRKMVGQSPSAFRNEMWQRKRYPERYIPACFLVMNGIPC